MKTEPTLTRRQFLNQTAAATVAAVALPAAFSTAAPASGKAGPWKICAFEKPLSFLSHDELADFLREVGFDGAEATVRPGGRVVPERVEDDLPKLVEALKKRDLEITLMTTAIGSADQPNAEKVLRTAARLGVRRYRLAQWRYDLKQPVQAQLDALRPRVKDLVALNRELGVTGLYENHAGANMVGAPLWDIHSLIKDYDPKDIALAFDIRHAVSEGGTSWPIQFNLVRAHLDVAYVKDFEWEAGRIRNVPLGTGRVDGRFIGMLKETSFTGPIALHIEYLNNSKDRETFAKAFAKDLATLRGWLAA